MKPDKPNPAESAPCLAEDKPLTYAEFTQLLAHYKRTVYESIYQAKNPIEVLLKLK